MSELMNAKKANGFRLQLLTTVSALALLAGVYGSGEARAAAQDADRPTVWIELGGQFQDLSNAQEPYSPPFVPSLAQDGIFSPLRVQEPSHSGLDVDGTISFQPENSDWVLSASVQYGRSHGVKTQHQQTPNGKLPIHLTVYGSYLNLGSKYPSQHVKFANASATQSERHVVLDFQAGKDVGLGLFGNRGFSVVSAGVRIAQFSSKTSVAMRLEPDVHYPTKPITSFPALLAFLSSPPLIRFHDYAASADMDRNFRGIGPSLSWNASAPFAGNPDQGEMTLDWGLNASILFGRQKVSGHHQTSTITFDKQGRFVGNGQEGGDVGGPGVHGGYFPTISIAQRNHTAPLNRTRSVTVPNFGGFAGLSMRYSDVKLSLGYRADFFFGAMDGGIDTAKSENRGFYGPFATVSIGIGG